MTILRRGMIIDVNLDPIQGAEKGKIRPCVIVTNNIYNERVPVIQVVQITAWNEKKKRIKTIDYKFRLVKIRGELTLEEIIKINEALKIVFDL